MSKGVRYKYFSDILEWWSRCTIHWATRQWKSRNSTTLKSILTIVWTPANMPNGPMRPMWPFCGDKLKLSHWFVYFSKAPSPPLDCKCFNGWENFVTNRVTSHFLRFISCQTCLPNLRPKELPIMMRSMLWNHIGACLLRNTRPFFAYLKVHGRKLGKDPILWIKPECYLPF